MQENPVVLSLARAGIRERDISNNEGQIAESYFNYNPVDIDDLLLNPMDLYSGANCSISKVKGVISPAYVNLRGTNDVNPVFYDYYFKVQYWVMAFFAYGKGVSFDNRWTLNVDTLMNYPVVSMPYDEQCKRAVYPVSYTHLDVYKRQYIGHSRDTSNLWKSPSQYRSQAERSNGHTCSL